MTLSFVLRLIAPAFVLVGCLHLILGPDAEVMLGAQVSEQFLRDPVIDSQNRFYGVSFALYGILLFVCAMDLERYRLILQLVLWVFFAAGLARLVSLSVVGIPPGMILLLLASELLLPPALLLWLRCDLKKSRVPQAPEN